MAIIKSSLFSWQDVERSSDLTRFKKLLLSIKDRKLIDALYEDRKGRRNDYPIEAMWNSILAGIIFAHPTTASLIRELKRNAELRQVCGFNPLLCEDAVPSKDAYYRFFTKLIKYQNIIDEILHSNIEKLKKLLPDFGKDLAMDGKAIISYRKDDKDADLGFKKESVPDNELKSGEHTISWLGYKLHMICDSKYELPVSFKVTKASKHESPYLKTMLREISERHTGLLKRTKTFSADRGFDDGEDKQYIYEKYGISPIIPARNLSKKMEMIPIDETKSDTIYYSGTGQVFCKIQPFKLGEEYSPMQCHGYEKDRGTLKFRCPAAAYGKKCENQGCCRSMIKDKGFGRIVRIPINKDPRLFLPIYSHSKKFKREYNKRTSTERVFSRIDNMFGFEEHRIFGLKRTQLKVALTMIAMTSTAIGYIKSGEEEKIRRYFQVA
ncbi:MAG: transposase [Prolixibacteraceae bacterium]|nr:transposase [Prolixibacteraceae bacterium]